MGLSSMSQIAFAKAVESSSGTIRPVLPSWINSGTPQLAVATIGSFAAAAYSKEIANPSPILPLCQRVARTNSWVQW